MSEEGYKNIIKTYEIETNELYEEIAKLKSTLEEIREVVKELELHYQQSPTMIPSLKLGKLLQIIDKGVNNE